MLIPQDEQMHFQPADELRPLRERAYGRNADIQQDPAALRRLAELEAPKQTSTRTVAAQTEQVTADFSPGQDSPAAIVAVPPEGASRVRTRWRLPLLWVTSVLVPILVIVVISGAIVRQPEVDPHYSGATQVARLGADPTSNIPAFFSGGGTEDARGFSEFYGLRVLVSSGGYTGQYNDECLFVMTSQSFESATNNSFEGQLFDGCAANAFVATVAIKVTRDMPEELRREYPEGTALQFAYDEEGSEVVVFTSAAAARKLAPATTNGAVG